MIWKSIEGAKTHKFSEETGKGFVVHKRLKKKRTMVNPFKAREKYIQSRSRFKKVFMVSLENCEARDNIKQGKKKVSQKHIGERKPR